MRRPECFRYLFAALVAVVAVVLTSSPVAAAPSASQSGTSAEEKSADPAKLRRMLDELAAEHEKSQQELGKVSSRADELDRQVNATKKKLTRLRARVAQIAQTTYINGGVDDTVLALLDDGGPEEVAARATTLSVLSTSNDQALQAATKERQRLSRQRTELNKVKKQAAAEEKKLQKRRDKLNAALRDARAAAREAEEKASRADVRSGGACPVGKPRTISDTWGAARSGGRSHQGTDILAPMGTPTYAVEAGTITRAGNNSLGGYIVILKGNSGDSFYYAHHSANLVRTGQKVTAGEQVGKVGMSGNAQGTVSHLHFERWPNGGNAVNPYPYVRARCGN